MKYFAYGSNMAPARLGARVGPIERVGVYVLAGHDLRFHKDGQDGSAKCDAYRTDDPGDRVEGVVFEIESRAVTRLDAIEGVGNGYDQATVHLINDQGHSLLALAYMATKINRSLRPFFWYKHHVLVGARSAGLSPDYISRIENVPTMADPDASRAAKELGLYDPERPDGDRLDS